MQYFIFILAVLLSLATPAISTNLTTGQTDEQLSSDKILWQDDAIKICLTLPPNDEDVSVLSFGLVTQSDIDAPVLHFTNSLSHTSFCGTLRMNRLYLEAYKGNISQLILDSTGQMNLRRIKDMVLSIPTTNPLYAEFTKIGFKEIARLEKYQTVPTVDLIFTFDQTKRGINMDVGCLEYEDEEDIPEFSEMTPFDPELDNESELGIFLRDKKTNEILGGAYCEIIAPKGQKSKLAMLEYLWIKDQPNVRGCGFGKRLIALLEEQTRSLGCSRLQLNTTSNYAWSFYPKMGFEILLHGKGSIVTPEGIYDAYTFSKNL